MTTSDPRKFIRGYDELLRQFPDQAEEVLKVSQLEAISILLETRDIPLQEYWDTLGGILETKLPILDHMRANGLLHRTEST